MKNSSASMIEMSKNMDFIEMNDVESDFMDIDIDDLLENKCENYVYIDIQGFRTSRNRFICKEFCLVDGDSMFHTFVKSPYSFNKMPAYYRRQANWLINRFHGIKYEHGDTHIIELKQTMFTKIHDKTILVKGIEKIAWLQYIFRDCGKINCVNIEDMDVDLSLDKNKLFDVCEYHNRIFGGGNGPCAMTNALILQHLYDKNSRNIE